MGSRFRLRISKVIPSICCSKGHSRYNDPLNPVLSQLSTVVPTVVPKSKPRRSSSLGRHVSRRLTSCGVSPRSKPTLSSDESEPTTCRLSQWRKEEKYWQVVEITETPRRKVYNSFADENDNVVSPPPPSSADAETEKRHVSRQRRRVNLKPKFTEMTLNYETEALVSSSRSSSSDLKENDNDRETTTRMRKKTKTKKKRTVCSRSLSESEWSTPARLSVFQRMIPCRVEGKVRESFAVVKRSDDPYEDFKRSMTEMILEKQMFDDEDLEQLLHCFLSLNSKSHHGVIVEAFVEIWEALFSGSARSTVSSTRRLSGAL